MSETDSKASPEEPRASSEPDVAPAPSGGDAPAPPAAEAAEGRTPSPGVPPAAPSVLPELSGVSGSDRSRDSGKRKQEARERLARGGAVVLGLVVIWILVAVGCVGVASLCKPSHAWQVLRAADAHTTWPVALGLLATGLVLHLSLVELARRRLRSRQAYPCWAPSAAGGALVLVLGFMVAVVPTSAVQVKDHVAALVSDGANDTSSGTDVAVSVNCSGCAPTAVATAGRGGGESPDEEEPLPLRVANAFFWLVLHVALLTVALRWGPPLAHAYYTVVSNWAALRLARSSDPTSSEPREYHRLLASQQAIVRQLAERVEGVASERGGMVALAGDTGTGKSTVLRAFIVSPRKQAVEPLGGSSRALHPLLFSAWEHQAEPDLEFAMYREVIHDPTIALLAWAQIPWYRAFTWPLLAKLRATLKMGAVEVGADYTPRVDWRVHLKNLSAAIHQDGSIVLVVDEVDRATPKTVQEVLTLGQRFFVGTDATMVLAVVPSDVKYKAFLVPPDEMLPDLRSSLYAFVVYREGLPAPLLPQTEPDPLGVTLERVRVDSSGAKSAQLTTPAGQERTRAALDGHRSKWSVQAGRDAWLQALHASDATTRGVLLDRFADKYLARYMWVSPPSADDVRELVDNQLDRWMHGKKFADRPRFLDDVAATWVMLGGPAGDGDGARTSAPPSAAVPTLRELTTWFDIARAAARVDDVSTRRDPDLPPVEARLHLAVRVALRLAFGKRATGGK